MPASRERANRIELDRRHGSHQRAGLSFRHALLFTIPILSLCAQNSARPDCPFVSYAVARTFLSIDMAASWLSLFAVGMLWYSSHIELLDAGVAVTTIFTIQASAYAAAVTCRDMRLLGFIGLLPGCAVSLPLVALSLRGHISASVETAVLVVLSSCFAASSVAAVGVVGREGGVGAVLAALLACYVLSIPVASSVWGFGLYHATRLAVVLAGGVVAVGGFLAGSQGAKDKIVLAALLVLCALSMVAVADAASEKNA